MTSDSDFKIQLRAAYDADARRRTDNEKTRQAWKLAARQRFADQAKADGKKTVLEIGAGVGVDSVFFKSQGFDVLATDLSPQMVHECQQKGLNAEVLDIYELSKLGQRFDAIYSLNVLLHIPKSDLPHVLKLIHDALNPNGVFFYGVYGGPEKEETFTDPSKMNLPRFFSFLSDETQSKMAAPYFEVIESKAVGTNDKHNEHGLHFQSLLLRKK